MKEYKITKKSAEIFQKGIYDWVKKNPRPMPWKGEKDPYKIWISEIILQQTRVQQGWLYYQRFIQTFPNIQSLANASLDQVLKLWEGLGYYSRARNLHQAAKEISSRYDGIFPSSYQDILSLKGIGEYTASAIASFAYNHPYAVLDGNVHRILSRYLGINKRMNSSEEKKIFRNLANDLLDISASGIYNQAIMDFGATCCLPQSPQCHQCPLAQTCIALALQKVKKLPPPKILTSKKERHFHYIVSTRHGKTAINQRKNKDIWRGLFEFPLVETKNKNINRIELKNVPPFMQLKQVLSHQIIHCYFYFTTKKIAGYTYITLNQIDQLAFPVCIKKNLPAILQTKTTKASISESL